MEKKAISLDLKALAVGLSMTVDGREFQRGMTDIKENL